MTHTYGVESTEYVVQRKNVCFKISWKERYLIYLYTSHPLTAVYSYMYEVSGWDYYEKCHNSSAKKG